MADAAARKSAGLAPTAHVNGEPTKRDDADFPRRQSVADMCSPSFHAPGPPPPSLSLHPSPNIGAALSNPSGYLSPPGSRRTSDDHREPQPALSRQSLPSIHEALAAEHPLAYPGPPPPTSQAFLPPDPSSPVHLRHRKPSTEDQKPPRPSGLARPQSPYRPAPAAQPPPPPLPLAQPAHTSLMPSTPQQPSIPALQPPTAPSLHLAAAPRPYAETLLPPPSSTYSPATAPAAMHPHSRPLHILADAPHDGPGHGYVRQSLAAPQRYAHPPWRDHGDFSRVEERKQAGRTITGAYGESIKRHLETFDLEASLNEIAEGAGRIVDFSKLYGQRAHQTQRSGATQASLPMVDQVDAMLQYSETITVSLHRIRDVVRSQRQVMKMEEAQDGRFLPANGYDGDGRAALHDEPKGEGGFAGADTKKRRGRAAPPGRCHSCNRVETPEWRRGPDGARTLCNACGLHYAKLTRKLNAGHKSGARKSSNAPSPGP